MLSFRSTILALAIATTVISQGDKRIDPESVPSGVRERWCDDQKQTCPIICQQVEPRTTLVNTCDPETLTYGCLCGDERKPNISEYTLTLPYFICQEWGTQCVAACGSDNTCASACREDNPCGALDPKRENKTETTSSSTSEPTASSTTDDGQTIFTDTPGDESDSDNSDDNGSGASALVIGRTYGLAIVFGTMFAGFAML